MLQVFKVAGRKHVERDAWDRFMFASNPGGRGALAPTPARTPAPAPVPNPTPVPTPSAPRKQIEAAEKLAAEVGTTRPTR